MDYLDPQSETRHRIVIMIGYLCIAVAITLAALILLYQAYGFGFGKNGKLIQNGLTFFSSQPNPASIYVDGKLQKVRTNTRLELPEGTYRITLARSGYRDWQRTIQLNGGSVEHFDYPLLVPKSLETHRAATYDAAPALVTQSPDRRWLLINQTAAPLDFAVYDLKNPTKPPVTISLPGSLLTGADTGASWQVADWADDNQHVLLKRVGSDKTEYVLLNRTDATTSLNLTQTLNIGASQIISFKNRKFDQYFLFDASSGTLQTASQGAPTPTPVLEHVLAFKSYGNDSLLYATDNGAPAGKVLVKLLTGSTTYTLRNFEAGDTYLLDLTTYNGTLYVAAGATTQNKVYIYKDPLGQLAAQPTQALVPAQVFHLHTPNYLSFSANAQYIMAENGQNFAVYDIENLLGFTYAAPQPLDAPQVHAVWMDGNRLTYTSHGQQLIFDYDSTNQQTLSAAAATYTSAFNPTYTSVFTIAPAAGDTGKFDLIQTYLLVPSDR